MASTFIDDPGMSCGDLSMVVWLIVRSALRSTLLERAVETGSRPHIGVIPLREINDAADICRAPETIACRRNGNHERHRNRFVAEVVGHFHDGIGAKRMGRSGMMGPSFPAFVGGRGLVRDRLPIGVGCGRRVDAARSELGGQCVHAERVDVGEAAEQINVRPRLRHSRRRPGQHRRCRHNANSGKSETNVS